MLYVLYAIQSFCSQLCLVELQHTAYKHLLGLGTFQVHESYILLVATILDSPDTDIKNNIQTCGCYYGKRFVLY